MSERYYFKFFMSDGKTYRVFCKENGKFYLLGKDNIFCRIKHWRWPEQLRLMDRLEVVMRGYDDMPRDEEPMGWGK